MNGTKFADLVKQLGFPVVVAGWLLYQLPQINGTLILLVEKMDRLVQLAERVP